MIAIDFSRRFDIIILPSPGNGKPRQMRVDRGGTHGFQGRPPTKPLVTTGGFPFLFEKIMIAIDFSRRFAIIILPSALKRGSHGRCAWTGVEHLAFSVGPPLNRSSLRAVFLCSETSHCFVVEPGKASVSRVFRVGGGNSPFLSFRARKHARSRGLDGRERDFAKCRQLHLYIARVFEL